MGFNMTKIHTDILFGSMSPFNKSDSFHQIWNKKSVDDEAGSIDTFDGGFTHCFLMFKHLEFKSQKSHSKMGFE